MVLNFGWDHQSMSKKMGQNYYTEYTLLAQCFYLLKTELGEATFLQNLVGTNPSRPRSHVPTGLRRERERGVSSYRQLSQVR